MSAERENWRNSSETRKCSRVRKPLSLKMNAHMSSLLTIHTRSWCFEEGILCCDGQVGTKLNAELPSQFIDAILPIDDQSSDPNILYSDLPSDVPEQYSFLDSPDLPSDESVQYSLLDSSDNNFLLSDTFLPSDNNIAFQSDDTGFLSANAEVDASWFQT